MQYFVLVQKHKKKLTLQFVKLKTRYGIQTNNDLMSFQLFRITQM